MGLRYFADLEPGPEEAIDALAHFLQNDYSYYVRAFAAESLGFFKKSERVLGVLTAALSQESVSDQVRYRAFLGFAELKSPAVLPLAEGYLKSGKWSWGKIGAVHAVSKSGKGHQEALELLLSLQSDPDGRIRGAAASAIADLGDSNTLPALEEWLSREPEGRAARRIRETIFALGQNVKEAEKVARLEDSVQKLTEETSKLKGELESLKAALEKQA